SLLALQQTRPDPTLPFHLVRPFRVSSPHLPTRGATDSLHAHAPGFGVCDIGSDPADRESGPAGPNCFAASPTPAVGQSTHCRGRRTSARELASGDGH